MSRKDFAVRSYRAAKTRVRKSTTHGCGLFAVRQIRKGEVVAVKGGHIIDAKTLNRLENVIADSELQITDDLYLAPLQRREREGVMMFLNHSCNPNVGVRGNIVFVAMRSIRAREELTIDYAMIDDANYRMPCSCGVPKCRGIITGRDWKRKDLQRKYRGYFSAYLGEKMSCSMRRAKIVCLRS